MEVDKTNVAPGDYNGVSFVANDVYLGYAGVWLGCRPNQNHTLTIAQAGNACINFSLEGSGLIGWLTDPSRTFNSGGDNRVFVFAGLAIRYQSRVIPGEKRVRRHQPIARLSGAERIVGTGKLACVRFSCKLGPQ